MRYFIDDHGKYREITETIFCDMKAENERFLDQALNHNDFEALEMIRFLFVTDDDGVIHREGK